MSYEGFSQEYSRYLFRKRIFILACIAVSAVAFVCELGLGAYHISFTDSLRILWEHISGNITDPDADDVVWNLRLPRALAGAAVGAGLGVCGCAMQSSLKNPLADPYTTGISSGASFGACLAIIAGFSVAHYHGDAAVVINAFLFALIPAALMIVFSSVKKGTSPSSVILIGIAVMYIFSACTTMMKYYADDALLADMFYWSVGTLEKAVWDNVWFMVFGAVLGVILIQLMAGDLNVLTVTGKNSDTLGITARTVRIRTLVIVSLVTALMVCFTGTIGFVGLIAPHVSRMFIGSDNRYLVPASAAMGMMILLCADCAAKSITMAGLPVGVITSLIGGPVFLFLLIKQRKSDW